MLIGAPTGPPDLVDHPKHYASLSPLLSAVSRFSAKRECKPIRQMQLRWISGGKNCSIWVSSSQDMSKRFRTLKGRLFICTNYFAHLAKLL